MSKSDALRRAVMVALLAAVALAIALLTTGCGTVLREYDPVTGNLVTELKIRSDVNNPTSQNIVQAPAEPPAVVPVGSTAEGSQPPAPFEFTSANGASLRFNQLNNSTPSLVWATFGNKAINTGAVAAGAYWFFDWQKAKDAGEVAVAKGGQQLEAFQTKEAAKTARNADDNATRLARELGREP